MVLDKKNTTRSITAAAAREPGNLKNNTNGGEGNKKTFSEIESATWKGWSVKIWSNSIALKKRLSSTNPATISRISNSYHGSGKNFLNVIQLIFVL